MDCREYREAHPGEPEGAREHLESCAECRSFRRTWDLIREYPSIEAGPGFSGGLRRKLAPSILRFAAPLAAAAAALMVAVLFYLLPVAGTGLPEGITDEQREIAENLDLLENLELLRALEFVSDGPALFPESPR
jgi:hypothetical protein